MRTSLSVQYVLMTLQTRESLSMQVIIRKAFAFDKHLADDDDSKEALGIR